MNRHPADVVSLLFGAVFTALGTIYLLPGVALRDLWDPRLWPLALVALGVLLVVSTIRPSGEGGRERSPGQGTDQPEDGSAADAEQTAELGGAPDERQAEGAPPDVPASDRPQR